MGRGVVLGDSWISPVDYVKSWGPYLKALSLLDDDGLQEVKASSNAVEVRCGKSASSLLQPHYTHWLLLHMHACN